MATATKTKTEEPKLGSELAILRGGPFRNMVVSVARAQDWFRRSEPVSDGNGGIAYEFRTYRRSTLRSDEGRAVFVCTPQ